MPTGGVWQHLLDGLWVAVYESNMHTETKLSGVILLIVIGFLCPPLLVGLIEVTLIFGPMFALAMLIPEGKRRKPNPPAAPPQRPADGWG